MFFQLFQTHNVHLKTIAKSLDAIYDDTDEIKQRLMKRDMQNVLALADAESGVTAFLPLARLDDNTDELFSNPVSAKAITSHIWYKIRNKGYEDPPLNVIMSYMCSTLFTEELRAYSYVDQR